MSSVIPFEQAYMDWLAETYPLVEQTKAVLPPLQGEQLQALLDTVATLQRRVAESEKCCAEMQKKLASAEDIKAHPIKYALENVVSDVETKTKSLADCVKGLMAKITNACKSVIENAKDNIALADGKLTELLGEKEDFTQAKNDFTAISKACEKAVNAIDSFFKDKIPNVGRNVKNAGRALVGKTDKIVATAVHKEKSIAAELLTAPFVDCKISADKAVKRADNAIKRTDAYLEKAQAVKDYRAEVKSAKSANKGEKAVVKSQAAERKNARIQAANTAIKETKPKSLLERLEEKKAQAKIENAARNQGREPKRNRTAEIGG